jgi:hypothetical protein
MESGVTKIEISGSTFKGDFLSLYDEVGQCVGYFYYAFGNIDLGSEIRVRRSGFRDPGSEKYLSQIQRSKKHRIVDPDP